MLKRPSWDRGKSGAAQHCNEQINELVYVDACVMLPLLFALLWLLGTMSLFVTLARLPHQRFWVVEN